MKKLLSIIGLVFAFALTANAQLAIQQSTATQNLPFFLVQSADHITPCTGCAPTVTISKNGGSFASPSGAVSEIANGWYMVAANATDSGTLGALVLHATGTGSDPADEWVANVIAYNPLNSTLGISNAAVGITIRTNQPLNNFMYVLFTSTGAVKTGATPSCFTSIAGAAFVACTNASSTEVGNGVYKHNLTATDLNGGTITLRFTATGASDTLIPIVTQP